MPRVILVGLWYTLAVLMTPDGPRPALPDSDYTGERHRRVGRSNRGVGVPNGGIELHLRALGDTLRALRVERGYSLGDVAVGTGLSSSFLSLVENGRSDISTGRLIRVARFLGVGLGDLLDLGTPHEVTIVRSDDRRAAEMSAEGLRIFPLVDDHDEVAMSPVVFELEVGARIRDLRKTEGVEHVLFVMRGAVEIVVMQGEVHVLGVGDGAYVRSPMSEIRNAGHERAEILVVAAAPASGRPSRCRPHGPAAVEAPADDEERREGSATPAP